VGRAIQKVQRRDPESGEWRAVAGVNSVTEVRAWAEETLGLLVDAF
jgi:hypothetical protein